MHFIQIFCPFLQASSLWSSQWSNHSPSGGCADSLPGDGVSSGSAGSFVGRAGKVFLRPLLSAFRGAGGSAGAHQCSCGLCALRTHVETVSHNVPISVLQATLWQQRDDTTHSSDHYLCLEATERGEIEKKLEAGGGKHLKDVLWKNFEKVKLKLTARASRVYQN